ncbi:hypothetical protein PN459_19640 [Microcystis aeruginosa CS-567/02-A1]|uniref:hypothetical protein n=1 Tax=Microcystis aeruginosa TaxID=1126 RepID=UPI0023303249|nr:hypothetical protein [Microcystis aeruginosa]MDB9402169.1 hypothetical protein [Microcystis aeruginosa CS-567/02-A1]
MKKYFELIKTYLNWFSSAKSPDTYQSLGKCDVLLCCHDVNRGDTLDGLPYSKLIDSVSEDLMDKGWVCRQFAHPFSVLTGNKAWGNPASGNRRFLLIVIYTKICKVFPFLSSINLSKNTKLPLSNPDTFYHELFDITQPSCVITIGSPDAMCRAARCRSIPVVELLHGIGYTPVPWGWDQKPACNLPTGILSLDDVSTKTFSALHSQGIEVKQIPHPFFRRFLNEESREKLPPEWLQKPTWLPAGKTIILVSLQWGYDGDHGSYTEFAGILNNGLIPDQVIDAVEQTRDTVFWLFRLHPVQLRQNKYNHHRRFLDKLIQNHPNCEWRESSMLPLPLILSYCAGHVTMGSMTAYEAAFMAVKSLLLCPTLKPNGSNSCWFPDLRELGFAELGDFDTGMIVKWVTTVSRCSHPFGTRANTDTDWNSAVEWMLGRIYKQ